MKRLDQVQASLHSRLPLDSPIVTAQEASQGKAFQGLLKQIEEAALEGGALDTACSELQELVSALKVPQQLCKDVGEPSLYTIID